MPAQKRSNDCPCEDEDDVELQLSNQNVSEESLQDDVEQEEQESDDDESPSSSSSDKDEFVFVNLSDVRKEVQCPICLGIIRKTRKVMECLHRFCRECIDKSMRLGNNECPACRAHCASRRSLRDDPNFDTLIALLYPDIDEYEAEEFAFDEEEQARNKQIQAAIAQTSRRQLEALGKKRATAKATATAFIRRSQARNPRGRRSRKSVEPQVSDHEADDDDNDNGARSSSSTEEPSTEVRPKRYKRWSGAQCSLASATATGGYDENQAEGSRKTVRASAGLASSPEILAWGGGGMRSNTRHGIQSGNSSRIARNRQLSKLVDHIKEFPENCDEDFQLNLVSLDGQHIPNYQKIHVRCKTTIPTTAMCKYVAFENGLQPDEMEWLLVKGNHSDVHPSAPSSVSPAEQSESVINPLSEVLQENQIFSDLSKNYNSYNLACPWSWVKMTTLIELPRRGLFCRFGLCFMMDFSLQEEVI